MIDPDIILYSFIATLFLLAILAIISIGYLKQEALKSERTATAFHVQPPRTVIHRPPPPAPPKPKIILPKNSIGLYFKWMRAAGLMQLAIDLGRYMGEFNCKFEMIPKATENAQIVILTFEYEEDMVAFKLVKTDLVANNAIPNDYEIVYE